MPAMAAVTVSRRRLDRKSPRLKMTLCTHHCLELMEVVCRLRTSSFLQTSSDPCLQCRRPRFGPWVGKIPWRREWQPTPVFLPGESHGQRSLGGYSSGIAKSWTQLRDYTYFRFHDSISLETGTSLLFFSNLEETKFSDKDTEAQRG